MALNRTKEEKLELKRRIAAKKPKKPTKAQQARQVQYFLDQNVELRTDFHAMVGEAVMQILDKPQMNKVLLAFATLKADVGDTPYIAHEAFENTAVDAIVEACEG
jgi:hypothetical protein